MHNGGGVWVLDANRRVQEFTRDGAFVRGFRLGPCDGSNDPVPAAKGGLEVTAAAIYVAHPCADSIERFPASALPTAGTGSPPSVRASVYSPHGIAAPASTPSPPGPEALHVTQPRSSAVRRYDLSTLAQIGDAAPITHTGSPDDVHLGGDAGEGRIIVSETQNPAAGYAHRVYAYQSTAGAYTEIFNLGGLGSAPGQLNGAGSLDAVEGGLAASIVVADRANQRIQRLSAASPSDAGNVIWVSGASDPGPPPVPPDGQVNLGGGGGGGGAAAGGAGGGAGGGRPGVAINDGARFTATPNVLLRIEEPAGANAIEIAHRAGFGSPTRVASGTRTLDWNLLVDAPDRVRRRVFVRFPGAGRGVVSDEIRLDRRRPRVGSARLVRRRGGWVLRVVAADTSSGLAELQIASGRRGPYEPRGFKPRTRLERASHARYVRVADAVGNVSDTARARRARRR